MILLGVRTRVGLPGAQIRLFSLLRPVLLAVGVGVIRWLVGKGPPLPGLAGNHLRTRLEAERAHFGAEPPRPPEFRTYAAAAALASLVWFTPHLLHIRQVPDPGDPIFSAWRLARLAHQLTHDPRHLFDGNIFYPERWTLTYSDATILQGLAAAPFLAGGADPLIVSNALFLLAFPLCGLSFFYAGWRLTRDLRAGFVAGILGALYPFHTEHYSHLELQYFFFVPLALIALLDLLAAPTVRRGAILGILVAAQWLASMYFGIMLITFLVPFGVFAAAGWGVRPWRPLLRSAVVTAAIVAAALAATGIPYFVSQDTRGDRSYALVGLFSAEPLDYTRPHARLASHYWRSRQWNSPERALFPGFTAPALAIAAVAPPFGAVTAATIASAALAFDWSLGANGLTYDELYRWVLPYRGMRVAARFSIFVGTSLILLAAFGTSRLLRALRNSRAQLIAFLFVVAAVMIDLRPVLLLRNYWRTVPPIYAAVNPQMVLAEFPFEPGVDQMYFSTSHWARLFNGYSGFFPDSFIRMARQVDTFPSDSSLQALRTAGATHVTVNCALYRRRCDAILGGLDASARVRLISSGMWEGSEVRLYELITAPSPGDGRSR